MMTLCVSLITEGKGGGDVSQGIAGTKLPASTTPPWARPTPSPVRVALVNMPFAIADRPSIQCGLLKAVLSAAGHAVDVHYLNLALAARLGGAFYHRLASPRRNNQLLGDWLFSRAVFDDLPEPAQYLANTPAVEESCQELGLSFDELCEFRSGLLPKFLDECVEEVDWSRYSVVGFTSTFEQHVAVLALARRIKNVAPGTTMVIGGANVDDEMGPETIRAFPWVDFAVVGEGEATLCNLVERVAEGLSPLGLPGVVGRTGEDVVSGGRSPSIVDLDSLPDPDYEDYFDALVALGPERVVGDRLPLLLVESSRGCWWGQKHHCTFCGLNTNGMAFRSKSPERVLAELTRLSQRHALLNFEAVDNIMDPRYMRGLWDVLAEERYDFRFFYEVKANLSRAQLRTMARAGVHAIQPGIESLSTGVLSLMRKGTTLLDNVRVLKWARHYDVRAGWNLLTGFPGESRQNHEEQAGVIPLLTHLQPPTGIGRVWLERFSPFFFDPQFPVRNRRPEPAYGYVYPSTVDLEKIAYFFAYEMDGVAEVPLELRDAVARWRNAWQGSPRPSLVYQRAPDWLQILDRRDPSDPGVVALHGVRADAYEACGDWQRTPQQVAKRLGGCGRAVPPVTEVREMLDEFCAAGLMLREAGRYLSLAHPVGAR